MKIKPKKNPEQQVMVKAVFDKLRQDMKKLKKEDDSTKFTDQQITDIIGTDADNRTRTEIFEQLKRSL